MILSKILTLNAFWQKNVARLQLAVIASLVVLSSVSQAQIRNATSEKVQREILFDLQDPIRRAVIIKKFQQELRSGSASKLLENAEIVLVGSGPHTLTMINGLLAASADPEALAKRIVVVEASDYVGGNFWNGQWHLNSQVYASGVETNELPKALFQISDFVAAQEFPMAFHMGEAVALNFMVLAKQGVRFVTNTELKNYRIEGANSVHLSLQTAQGKKIETDVGFLGLGTGLGSPSLGRIKDAATQEFVQKQVAQNTDLNTFKGGVIDSHVWLTSLHTISAAKVEELVRNGDIAVIGYRHTATVAAESLLGTVHDRDLTLIQRTAARVSMYGLKAKTGAEFLDTARLGGTEEVSPAYYSRNVALGLPAAIDSGFVQGIPAYVQKMIPTKDGVTIMFEQDGKTLMKKHKIVILAVGQNNDIFNLAQSEADTKLETKAIFADLNGIKQEVGKQLVVVTEGSIAPAPVVMYGPAANQTIEPAYLNLSLVRGRNSVDVQKQLTWQMALHAVKNFFNFNRASVGSMMCMELF